MGGRIVNLNEYDPSREKPYHFESSQSFCDPEKVIRATVSVREELDLDANDHAQLAAIVALETLRCRLAESSLELPEYQQRVQEVVRDCDASCGRSPFDPTEIHGEFYERLNSVYAFSY